MSGGVEVPLRCREESGYDKGRPLRANRSAVVWACLGVCSVVLIKAVVIGSSTFSLLDPRFGGVDGLGVLTSARAPPARQQELATVGRSMDAFRDARGAIVGTVPRRGVQGSLFGDDGPGKLPGVNQDAWLSSKMGQGVHFFSANPNFVRAPHPRRPMLRRVRRPDGANARGPLARLQSRRTPDALARMVSRSNLLRERARLASLNPRTSMVDARGSLPSNRYAVPQKLKGDVDDFAGGTLFRAGTTATSIGGSLSPRFKSDSGNANGALAAVHGEKSWELEAHDNGWASPVKDDGWATAVHDNGWAAGTHDNGWATESKQDGWATAVHDDGWASSPSAAAAHGALMSVHSGNAMGSLSQVVGGENGWSKEPSRSSEMGALASTKSRNVMGSLSAVVDGEDGMGSLAHTKGGNSMGGLSLMKQDATNSMGSLASLKPDPETNGALANFKQIQAETDGALASLKDILEVTGGAGAKASNSAGSLANARGSDVWGSLSSARGRDLANGVLSVTKNREDVDGSLSGFKYGKNGEQVGGSLANVRGSDVGGSLSSVKGTMADGVLSTSEAGMHEMVDGSLSAVGGKSEMVGGALSAVGGKVDKSEMVGGTLSAVARRPQLDGWLSRAPGLRGRTVKMDSGNAESKHAAKGAVQSEKEVQKMEQQAAALHYMLGKELSEAVQKRAAQKAEEEVKGQEKKLEALLKASKKKVEVVQTKMERAEAQARAARQAHVMPKPVMAAPASASVASGGGSVASSAVHGHAVKAAIVSRDAMHVAKGQQKKQQKLDEDEGDALDDNEDDIGWHKTHWSTLAWVMFIMFGPVFTTAVVGLVGYYTGTVAALATCLLLVCMDIACYYYSWFLW